LSKAHPLTMDPGVAAQLFIESVNASGQFQIFRIGDEVEDILFLIYQLIPDIHKFDQSYHHCRTLTEENPINAAIQFLAVKKNEERKETLEYLKKFLPKSDQCRIM